MERGDVAAFVERARAAIADAPGMGARNTQLRVVEPLLSLLGWDVRSSSVEAAYVAGDETVVDYALCIGERPGAFVSVAACGESLSVAGRDDLVAAMRSSNVDRGLYTNGREYVLVALHGSAGRRDQVGDAADRREPSVEQVRLELGELPECVGALSALHHETVAAASSRGRRRFARALVEAEESAVDRVTDAVVDAAIDGGWAAANRGGESGVRDEVEPLARRFLEAVVEAVAPDAANVDSTKGDASPVETNADSSTDPTNAGGSSGASRPRERRTAAGVSTLGGRSAAGEDASGDGSEFVVRFFEDGRSVGAVGNPDAASAVAQAVQYLLDERGLGPRLQFPYVPDDGDDGSIGDDGSGGGGSGGDGETAFLHREPTHPDGRPMSSAVDLGGVYVHTAADLDVLRERVEALAGRSGLRVMFSGDWPDAP